MDILRTFRQIKPPQYIMIKEIASPGTGKGIRNQSTALDLAYKMYGPSPTPNSEPVIVLHGLLGSKRNWQSMCKKITDSTNKSVIAVDARNHGDSPHSAAHTYLDLAADVSKLISKLSVKKSVVIGHSMGGRTAMVLALTEPTIISSLIVVDITPIPLTTKLTALFPKIIETMKSVNFKGIETLDKAVKAAKDALMEAKLFRNDMNIYHILLNVGKLSDNSFGWKVNVDALQKNFSHIASFPNLSGKTFNGPTIFIGGRNSDFLPADHLSQIRVLFPKADLVYINNVGHNVHVEDPDAFFDIVMTFLTFNSKTQAQI